MFAHTGYLTFLLHDRRADLAASRPVLCFSPASANGSILKDSIGENKAPCEPQEKIREYGWEMY